MDIVIPGYEIIREIGYGGMATVYLARQTSVGRDVALKVLSPSLVHEEGFTKRFIKEGATIANLMHPNIIKVFDCGQHNDNYYLAMEYFYNGTLKQCIQEGLEAVDAVRILRSILEALRYAHNQGLIHRDIKSQNILMYEDGTPVVSDFGIVKIIGERTMLTMTGLSVGSPLYMSPEQIQGNGEIDERADLYSVGILFHEMLTGSVPYDAEETFAVAFKHIYDPIPALPADVAMFQDFQAKLLAKEPDERFANAAAALDALSYIQPPAPFISNTQPIDTVVLNPAQTVAEMRPVRNPVRSPRKSQRKTGMALSVIALSALAGGAGYYYWQQNQSPNRVLPSAQTQIEQQVQQENQRQTELEHQRAAERFEQQRQAELERQQAEQQRIQQQRAEQQRQTELERQKAEQQKTEQQRIEQTALQQQLEGYLDNAHQARQEGDLVRSLEHITSGLALRPDSSELLQLLQQVQQQLSMQRAAERAQKVLNGDHSVAAQQDTDPQAQVQQAIRLETSTPIEEQPSEPQQAPVSLADARQAFKQKNYNESLKLLNALLAREPNNRSAQQLQRQAKAAQGETRLGLSRSQRRAIQQALTDIGFSTNGVDGLFGANTRRAIESFQRRRALAVSGYLNSQQIAMLEKAAAKARQEKAQAQATQTAATESTLPTIELQGKTNQTEPSNQATSTPTTSAPTTVASAVITPVNDSAEWLALNRQLSSAVNSARALLSQASGQLSQRTPRAPSSGAPSSCVGDCTDGNGTYYFRGGDIYSGAWRNDQQNGRGTYFFRDGSVYTGNFNNDQRSGLGTFYYPNRDVYYGNWRNGMRQGRGIYKYLNGIRLYGQYRRDRLSSSTVVVFYNNGDIYAGEWRNDKKHGKGVYYESNGNKYAGEWRNNVKVKVVGLN